MSHRPLLVSVSLCFNLSPDWTEIQFLVQHHPKPKTATTEEFKPSDFRLTWWHIIAKPLKLIAECELNPV